MRKVLKISYGVALAAIMLFAPSCASKFQKLRKSTNVKNKLAGADSYYEAKKYYKASLLYEEIQPVLRGAREGEDVLYKLAYSHFYQKDYIIASHYFERFYNTYGRSPRAEEARYQAALCKYNESPRSSLDQSSTKEAAEAMQSFLNRYPNSEHKQEATKIIDEMQNKLALKAFENARQYFKISKFKAAVVAFENFRKGYPDSDYNEEAGFMKIKAQYEYAKLSFYLKQKERFQKAIRFYEDFVDRYPNSKYLKKAEKIYENSIKEVKRLAGYEKPAPKKNS
ncbi:MAG: outer membrane protein assembly factor BamD [Cytophagales bacterium]|nr:outer membrane protein assembly factor BamD [Cytophagales bacterium]